MNLYNKIKAQEMCDSIQQLFLPDYSLIDEQFPCQQMRFNNKLQESLLIEEINSHDQNPQSRQQKIFEINNDESLVRTQENTQKAKKQQLFSNKPKRKIKASKLNQKMGFVSQIMKIQKSTKIKKKINQKSSKAHSQYPTKNFLQNFKVAHLDLLQTKFSLSDLQKYAIFFKLKMKNGISMQDYQQLYSVIEFRITFQQMFRSKYLYRSMMLSRSRKQARINHIKKLSVFDQSFRTKSFKRIN